MAIAKWLGATGVSGWFQERSRWTTNHNKRAQIRDRFHSIRKLLYFTWFPIYTLQYFTRTRRKGRIHTTLD